MFVRTSHARLKGELQDDPKRGITSIEPVVRHAVEDMHTLVEALRDALERRSVASTNMNEQSSRAHTILQVQFEASPRHGCRARDAVRYSTLSFVDLAGSERLRKSKTTGARACAPEATDTGVWPMHGT
jgi:Kinesin motor domain